MILLNWIDYSYSPAKQFLLCYFNLPINEIDSSFQLVPLLQRQHDSVMHFKFSVNVDVALSDIDLVNQLKWK